MLGRESTAPLLVGLLAGALALPASAVAAIELSAPQPYSAAASGTPQDLALGELTGDSKPEIVVGVRPQFDTEQAFFTVNVNSGTGTFGTPGANGVGTGEAVDGVVVGDADGDGDGDVVTGNRNGVGIAYFGNGAGAFVGTAELAGPGLGGSVLAPAIGKLIGDGDPDIVSGNEGPATLYEGNGNGTYDDPVELGTGVNASSSLVADIDRDHDRDVVVAGFSGSGGFSGMVSVLRNKGDGRFKAALTEAVGNGPVEVAVADVSGDRKLEVLARSAALDKLPAYRIRKGKLTGAGKFPLPAGGATGLASADFDDDGRADVITSTAGGDLAILRGKPSGGLRGYVTAPGGAALSRLAAADLNGDGAPDLAGLGAQVQVLLNTGP